MEPDGLALEEAADEVTRRLEASDSILIVSESHLLHQAITIVAKRLLNMDRYGIYLSLNKPHKSIMSMLGHASVDTKRMFFVDCVTALTRAALTKKDERVIYAASPEGIEVGGAIPKAILEFVHAVPGEKFLIIDTLRTLLIYNEPAAVSDFIHCLLSLTAAHELKIVVLTRADDARFNDLISKAFNEVIVI
jgi:archaellum biogenesis ATPase FlaH